MSSVRDTASFFTRGNSAQFEYVLALYPQVLQLKANSKCKKPDELIKLDDWYQNKLPQLIKKRGKDQYMLHEELVKTMKWKQTRGKFFPQLSYLIKVNTPRAVQAETKKAFRKLPNLEQAITALSNLKGVGTTMASALLAAAAPETAPFMADECLMAIPEIEGIDYTTREYMNFVQHIQTTTDRLNRECHPVPAGEEPAQDSSNTPDASAVKGNGNGTSAEAEADASDAEDDSTNSSNEGTSSAEKKKNQPDTTNDTLKAHEKKWSPHRVELALWTHYVASELQPDLLENIPEEGRNSTNDTNASSSSGSNHNKSDSPDSATKTNGATLAEEPSDESNSATEHGKSGPVSDESSKLGLDSLDECTKSEDSMEKPSTTTPASTTATTTTISSTTTSSRKRPVPANHLLSSSKRRSADGERNSSGDDDDDDDGEASPRLSKHTKIG
ncbi:dentin sialophosphoprotein-like [Anopheles ziemanni]|uniref:dentin sialophosphoprotein-like n=1 Tax=Anopheles ziemanni TaxID=345580 RepID=UPI002657B1E0|nr:dentin sialophosphoprotein-like isoform X2 [Anopheles coustani]XP_058171903.1 dentin sialophosphoprotein-like [Anopheles ziemanni]